MRSILGVAFFGYKISQYIRRYLVFVAHVCFSFGLVCVIVPPDRILVGFCFMGPRNHTSDRLETGERADLEAPGQIPALRKRKPIYGLEALRDIEKFRA